MRHPRNSGALVDVTDGGLLQRQPQADAGQHRRDLLTHRLGIVAGAGHEHREVVRIPHDPVVGLSLAASPFPHHGGAVARPCSVMCSSSTVKARLLSRRETPTLWGAGDGVPDRAVLGEDARGQERLDNARTRLVGDPLPHPLQKGGV
jgi:hypothetical protein